MSDLGYKLSRDKQIYNINKCLNHKKLGGIESETVQQGELF